MIANPIRLPIDDLQTHLATLKAELKEGHVVELVSGTEILAEMHQPRLRDLPPADPGRQLPDFLDRLRAIYGREPLKVDTTAWVREDRNGDEDLPGH